MPLKIRSKLIVAFLGLIIVILAVAAITGYYSQQSSDKAVQRIQAISEEVVATANLGHALEHAIMPANDYLITGNKRYADEFKKVSAEMEERLSETKKLLDRLYALKLPKVEDERNWLNEIEVAWQNIKESSLRIFEIPEPVGNRDGVKLMEEMDYRWAGEATDLIHKWHEVDTEEYGAAIGAAERVKRLSWSIMAASGAILMILGVGFAVFYSRLFVRPIEAIHNGADAIAAGNFKTRVDIKTGDEIEQLANAMNEMAEQLDSFYGTLERQIWERTKELQYEKDKLTRIFEAMEDGVYIVDQNYDIEYINSFLEREYGPCKGIKCYTYFHDRTQVCPWCTNQRVWAGETVRWEWYSFKNGKTYDLIDTPLRQPDGSVWKLEIFRDITDKKKAETALKKTSLLNETIIESMPTGIAFLDNDFVLRRYNRAYAAFIQKYQAHIPYAPEDAIGKSYFDYVPGSEVQAGEWFRRVRDTGREETRYSFELVLNMEHPKKTYWDTCIAPVFNSEGKVEGILILCQDVTERKKAEDAIKQRIDELEQFRKVTIKRELRMEELQRKVDELERKVI